LNFMARWAAFSCELASIAKLDLSYEHSF